MRRVHDSMHEDAWKEGKRHCPCSEGDKDRPESTPEGNRIELRTTGTLEGGERHVKTTVPPSAGALMDQLKEGEWYDNHRPEVAKALEERQKLLFDV